MTDSILGSTKKVLGIAEADSAFDVDVLMHINSAFSTLNQLGIGPLHGYMIEDAVPTWFDYLGGDLRLNSVKQFIYISVRLVFDPPGTSFAIQALKDQLTELTWRINVTREHTINAPIPTEVILDGGVE